MRGSLSLSPITLSKVKEVDKIEQTLACLSKRRTGKRDTTNNHTDRPKECVLLFEVAQCYNCRTRMWYFTKQRHLRSIMSEQHVEHSLEQTLACLSKHGMDKRDTTNNHTDHPNECVLLFGIAQCYNCRMRMWYFTKQHRFTFHIVWTTCWTFVSKNWIHEQDVIALGKSEE